MGSNAIPVACGWNGTGWQLGACHPRPHTRKEHCFRLFAAEPVAAHPQAAEYTRQATVDSITIPVGPRLGDIVVEAEGLRKCYGERVLLDNATFRIPPGSVVGAAAALAARCPSNKCIVPASPRWQRHRPCTQRKMRFLAACDADQVMCSTGLPSRCGRRRAVQLRACRHRRPQRRRQEHAVQDDHGVGGARRWHAARRRHRRAHVRSPHTLTQCAENVCLSAAHTVARDWQDVLPSRSCLWPSPQDQGFAS